MYYYLKDCYLLGNVWMQDLHPCDEVDIYLGGNWARHDLRGPL